MQRSQMRAHNHGLDGNHRNDMRRLSRPSAVSRVARIAVTCAMTLVLLLNALPGPAAPTAQAAGVAMDGKGPAKPVKSRMHTRFAATPLTGTDCSAQSAPPPGVARGPKIYNYYVRGVTSSSATIMWESDAQATATLCFNTTAYPDYACTAAGVNAFCQTVNPNPGTSIPNAEIASQQIPSGNWLYTANISVNSPGTYHYQISLQFSSTQMTFERRRDLCHAGREQRGVSGQLLRLRRGIERLFHGELARRHPYWLGLRLVSGQLQLGQDAQLQLEHPQQHVGGERQVRSGHHFICRLDDRVRCPDGRHRGNGRAHHIHHLALNLQPVSLRQCWHRDL